MLVLSCWEVFSWSSRHWCIRILLVRSWKRGVLEGWWGLHRTVDLVRGWSLRETLSWNWIERRISLGNWIFYQVFDRILEIVWNKWLKISLRIFLLVLFLGKLLNTFFLLNFILFTFLYLLFFFLLFSLEKVKFLISFLLLGIMPFYLQIKLILCPSSIPEFIPWLLFQIFYGFVWLFLSFCCIFGSACSLILLEIWMLKYLRHFRSVFSINSENLLDNIDFHRIYIAHAIPNRLEKISDFFISAITSSPVSPLKGANPWISSKRRMPKAQISIL